MNKKFLLLLPALALMLGACGNKNPGSKSGSDSGQAETVTGVELDNTVLELQARSKFLLSATVKPVSLSDRTVTWSSDNAAVASVNSSGNVSALSVGTAKIRATANADTSKFAECQVTVTPYKVTVAAESVDLEKTFKLGTFQETLESYYFFTGEVGGDTRGITSAAWKQGVDVKLESAGVDTYYVTFMQGETKKYFEMSDDHHYAIVDTPTSGREWSWDDDIDTVTRTIGEKTYFPGTYDSFTTISGCDMAQLSKDFVFQFLYQVDPCEPETVTVTASDSKVYAGGTLQMKAKLGPVGAEGAVTWSVSGDEEVTIDEKSGLLSASADAHVGGKVTVKASYSETVYGELEIDVAEEIDYGTLDNPITIEDAVNIAKKFPSGTTEIATVKGLVTSSGAYSTKFNNWEPIWLTDGEVEQAFEGFRLRDGSSDGSYKTTYAAANSLVGKTITFQGRLQVYNTTTYETVDDADCKLCLVEDIPVTPTSMSLVPSEPFEIEQGGSKTVSAKFLPIGSTGTATFTVSPADQGVSYSEGKVVATETATTGDYTLNAECGSLNASVTFTVKVKETKTYAEVASYDLSAWSGEKYQSGDGLTSGLTEANGLKIFTGDFESITVTGTNPVTAATGSKWYQTVSTQGPGTGLKLGTGSAAGYIQITTNINIAKIVISVKAWSDTVLATVTIGELDGVALVAADKTTAKEITGEFDPTNSIKIASTVSSCIQSITLYKLAD